MRGVLVQWLVHQLYLGCRFRAVRFIFCMRGRLKHMTQTEQQHLQELGLPQENGCIIFVGSARLPAHPRGGGVNRTMVSGGGTEANEAGPRRNRG